ncbi:MAG: N-6 DNA methylase, partial [Planctomycetes bacterium]|nr:N-6 DNA methylase [Planctomycetota bacterium]
MSKETGAYLRSIQKELATGQAGEHAYRPALKALVESLGRDILAVNEPKRVACGAPDFQVLRRNTPIGSIECKDIGAPLGKTEKTAQMKRYLPALPNLILTDYLLFRYYVDGQQRTEVRLGRVDSKGKIRVLDSGAEQLRRMLDVFLGYDRPSVSTSKELAARMARMAQLIRESILGVLKSEGARGGLHAQMDGFRKVLLHDLTEAQFADMYAQTISYGLFTARVNLPESQIKDFNRRHAAYDLPKSNPFLRSMFADMAGPDLDDGVAWAVDELAEILRRSDIAAILADFGRATKREDPVVHFYETFLAAYDPKMREARGVYYTPEPVVSYIVRSIDHILKTDFGLKDGLADSTMIEIEVKNPKTQEKETRKVHKVQILDPACGTGTFLHAVVRHIRESFKGNEGMWRGYVSKHLLPRLYGFELLMAPYAVAHMKLGLLLKETGYDFKENERLNVFLTNTLEEAEYRAKTLFGQTIADEANAASAVKRDAPVMVILGNPPYSGHSENKGPWIDGLMRGSDTLSEKKTANYFEVDGKPLGERNPKWLNDDYVKFIRFAQWRIEKTGYGVLGFITNHGYLDNPTFRGMRQSLMDAFDDIHILDLHGNQRKKERCPDGSKDTNVFAIKQGVAVGLFARKHRRAKATTARHSELWGQRTDKYQWLFSQDIASTSWEELEPRSPDYVLKPVDDALRCELTCCWRVSEAMPVTLLGPNSHRDHFAVCFDYHDALVRIADLENQSLSDEALREKYAIKDNRDWKLSEARKSIPPDEKPRNCIYRPFDFRYMLYGRHAFDYHRPEVNDHLALENLAVITTRQTKEAFATLATNVRTAQHKIVSRYDGSFVSPLYLYPPQQGAQVHTTTTTLGDWQGWPTGKNGREPNLSWEFVQEFAGKLAMEFVSDGKGDLKKTFGPEDIFNYIYAVFH